MYVRILTCLYIHTNVSLNCGHRQTIPFEFYFGVLNVAVSKGCRLSALKYQGRSRKMVMRVDIGGRVREVLVRGHELCLDRRSASGYRTHGDHRL